MSLPKIACIAILALAPLAHAAQSDWVAAEAGLLENHVQLTSEEQFSKAGECYFSPDGTQIIFQAVEKMADPEDEEAFYQMYVADLRFDGGRVQGITNVQRLSPPGSSNTCGWFHPTEPGVVIFGSTIGPPSDPGKTGYQREGRDYSWQFPKEMDIVRCELATADGTEATLERLVASPEAYLAECAISADGRSMVYCEHQVADGTTGGDLLIMDLESRDVVSIASSDGYDGGPFWSPDGKRLCYRSDRRGDVLLQIFVAELAFDEAGKVTGVEREFQLTDNAHVNWAPFWHPNGRHLVYATSEEGHENYEVFMIDADPGTDGGPAKYGTRGRRITNAAKFDGLPVFDTSGARMMWTSQRGADRSSQIWIADFVLPLEGDAQPVAQETAAPADANPDRQSVLDPDTGLYFVYDMSTHSLSVYDPKTHAVRDAEGDEVQKAMRLFNEQGDDG